MSLELFRLGPAVYIPLLIISLLITLLTYGAFPLIFAAARKSGITKKRYRVYCFIVNFIMMIIFIGVNGEASSGAPYVLWTLVFSAAGAKILDKKGCFAAAAEDENNTSPPPPPAEPAPLPDLGSLTVSKSAIENENKIAEAEKARIKFCQNCGFELIEGSKFCSKCGTATEI